MGVPRLPEFLRPAARRLERGGSRPLLCIANPTPQTPDRCWVSVMLTPRLRGQRYESTTLRRAALKGRIVYLDKEAISIALAGLVLTQVEQCEAKD